jgi:4'-phosphopantetheinyl transferase
MVEVDIWIADLRTLGELDPSGDGGRRRLARAFLLHVLAAATGAPPSAIRLGRNRYGKPTLQWPKAPIAFNLSHTADLIVCGVSPRGVLGVDVEAVRPVRDAVRIAARMFTSSELLTLHRMPPKHRDAAFLGCWARKEAVVKALGCGLHLPLDAFEVSVPPDPAALLRPPPTQTEDRWTMADLPLPGGYVGAVALITPDPCIVRPRSVWEAMGPGSVARSG